MSPLLIVLSFWGFGFFFVLGAFSGSWGFSGLTGYAIFNGQATQLGAQSIAILILFFSNIVSIFFLVREMAKNHP